MDKRLILNGILAALVLGACSMPAALTPPPGPRITSTASSAGAPTGTVAAAGSPTHRPGTPEPVEFNPCTVGGGLSYVVVIVDPRLTAGIRDKLTRFENDLCLASYAVLERRGDFATPADVRAYLIDLARRVGELSGAIFVGDIPHAYQYVTLHSANPSIPSTSEEAISFQYYSDLDGTFGKSPGYVSAGGHEFSYDLHDGKVDWEIWTGILPIYENSVDLTVDAVNRYFDKNHAYRTGGSTIPRGFLQVSEFFDPASTSEDSQILAGLVHGEYAWTPFSNGKNSHIYFDSSTNAVTSKQGYSELTQGVADFTVVDAHGFYGGVGQLDVMWVKYHKVATIFLWSNGCAVGDLDQPANWLAASLYSLTSSVLVAKGTTNDSGGLGSNVNGFFGHNIATALLKRDTFGDALLSHINYPLRPAWANDREFQYASSVTLGDPTLTLRTGP